MEELITLSLAVASVTYILCDSMIAEPLRSRFNPRGLFDCTFCNSFWVALVVSGFDILRCLAMMTIAALGIFVIRLSTATIEIEPNEEDLH